MDGSHCPMNVPTLLPPYKTQLCIPSAPQLRPYFSTPFCSKILKSVIIYTNFLHFSSFHSPKPIIPWKPLTPNPSVTSMLLILGVSSWSPLFLASQQHSAQWLSLLETLSSLGFQNSTVSWFSSASQLFTSFIEHPPNGSCSHLVPSTHSPLNIRTRLPKSKSHPHRSCKSRLSETSVCFKSFLCHHMKKVSKN